MIISSPVIMGMTKDKTIQLLEGASLGFAIENFESTAADTMREQFFKEASPLVKQYAPTVAMRLCMWFVQAQLLKAIIYNDAQRESLNCAIACGYCAGWTKDYIFTYEATKARRLGAMFTAFLSVVCGSLALKN